MSKKCCCKRKRRSCHDRDRRRCAPCSMNRFFPGPWLQDSGPWPWVVGDPGSIRHIGFPTNPFFVDPQTCYELLDEMLEFCAENREDYPDLCDERSIQALIAGCLAPYR